MRYRHFIGVGIVLLRRLYQNQTEYGIIWLSCRQLSKIGCFSALAYSCRSVKTKAAVFDVRPQACRGKRFLSSTYVHRSVKAKNMPSQTCARRPAEANAFRLQRTFTGLQRQKNMPSRTHAHGPVQTKIRQLRFFFSERIFARTRPHLIFFLD